jgi:hypothetical protein
LREKWTPGEDVLNGTLPFYHIYGLVVLLFCGHSRGASVVVTPRFDLEARPPPICLCLCLYMYMHLHQFLYLYM